MAMVTGLPGPNSRQKVYGTGFRVGPKPIKDQYVPSSYMSARKGEEFEIWRKWHLRVAVSRSKLGSEIKCRLGLKVAVMKKRRLNPQPRPEKTSLPARKTMSMLDTR